MHRVYKSRFGAVLVGATLVFLLAPGTASSLAGQQPSSQASTAATFQAAGQEALGLQEVIRIALERNRDVRDARLDLETAQEQVTEAWSGVYPAIDFSARYTRNISPSVSFLPAIVFDPNADPDDFIQVQFGADNVWNSTVSLEQPLFQAQAFIGVGAAGRFRTLQEEVLRGRTQAVVTQVRVAYFDLLLAHEEARLLENSIERVRQTLAETRSLFEAGLASEYDVLRLEVELANLEPNLRRAENAVQGAQRQLAVELDMDDADALRIAGSLSDMDLGDPDANEPENRAVLAFAGVSTEQLDRPEELVRQALEERSELRQLEYWESLRQTELRLEQAEYLPQVSLFGSYTIDAQQSGSPDFFGEGQQRAYGRFVGISVTVPLFTGRARGARVGQRRAALSQAQTDREVGLDRTEVEVTDLVEEVEESRLRAEGQRLAVRQATRGFEIATAQYREGLSGQLELTDSENALRESEFNYAQAVYDYLVGRARLDEATGRVPGTR